MCIIILVLQPGSSLKPPSVTPLRACISWGFLTRVVWQVEGVSLTPHHRLVDQASVSISTGDRVVQLYPQTLGIHFSRLSRHAWTTLVLFLFPTTTRELALCTIKQIEQPSASLFHYESPILDISCTWFMTACARRVLSASAYRTLHVVVVMVVVVLWGVGRVAVVVTISTTTTAAAVSLFSLYA